MTRIDRILLTTNLAPHSDRAMERAVQLALQHGADLTALYAIECRSGHGHGIEAEMRRHLMAVAHARALAPRAVALPGPVHRVAADYAALWQPDLMVAGAHRVSPPRAAFAVSTVERLSVASRTPLLVVRQRALAPYANALVAVDFSPLARRAVEAAFAMVPRGVIHLLHVDAMLDSALAAAKSCDGDAFQARFGDLLAGLDIGERVMGNSVRVGSPMVAIAEAAAEEPVDLIVLGTSGRTGLGRTLMGSTAHEILERLPSDVLLVRKP